MWHKRRFVSLLSSVLVFSIVALAGESARAEDKSPLFQVNGRFGFMSSSFVVPGLITGTYSSGNTFDLSIEYVPTKRVSYLVRQQLSFDSVSSSIRYLYTGLGSRFYWGPAGRTEVNETGSSFSSTPDWRFYGSWDAGVSQMLVNSLTTLFGTTVTLLEFYVGLGAIYQVSKDIGVQASAEYGNGFGFSNISASTQTTKFLIGASIFY